ncbi:hypothetical protein D6783_06035 [Candidatus Woesearchaeota archaeon]|nr:MAG: hypothetical protein D6783_06035 [Candidatus Woesearchaeota archaeon]
MNTNNPHHTSNNTRHPCHKTSAKALRSTTTTAKRGVFATSHFIEIILVAALLIILLLVFLATKTEGESVLEKIRSILTFGFGTVLIHSKRARSKRGTKPHQNRRNPATKRRPAPDTPDAQHASRHSRRAGNTRGMQWSVIGSLILGTAALLVLLVLASGGFRKLTQAILSALRNLL